MPVVDSTYRNERDRLLTRITSAIQMDRRVVAAWLAGSMGRGNADDLSDLDIWIALDDDAIADVIAQPIRFVHAIAPTVLQIEAPSNAPPGGAYLLTWIAGESGPLQVDWYWQPASIAVLPVSSQFLFDRRPVPPAEPQTTVAQEDPGPALDHAVSEALLMEFITAKHIRRGDPWTAIRHITHLSNCVGTVRWLLYHGYPPAYDDRVSIDLPQAPPIDSKAQLELVTTLADQLRELATAGGLAHMEDAFQQLDLWLERSRSLADGG